ncbi:hypothetical protein BCR35DRAFT_306887 [Leucosporidium creatinivorum]|uniref:Uncharacterized protein n=1 Tax=Leucosporidium creatinivorum TaxID=106004 RepID=A0A1Y2ES24_9BASI|nr:hypothetical protein BCR35DRAFT_306887 [Leucosporidium creatinivorum]
MSNARIVCEGLREEHCLRARRCPAPPFAALLCFLPPLLAHQQSTHHLPNSPATTLQLTSSLQPLHRLRKTHPPRKMAARSTSQTWLSLFAVLLVLALTILPSPTNALSLSDLTHGGHLKPIVGAPQRRAESSPKPDRSFAIKRGGKGRNGHAKRLTKEVQMRRRSGKGVRRLVVGEDGHY